MKKAKYWEALGDKKVRCLLCPHRCVILPDREGICGNKKNVGARLFAHHWGEVSALGMDPIEKKPLYHFYPGRMILSAGTTGCNLACSFCQNHHLVNGRASTDRAQPEEIVRQAERQHSFAIAYTYNEPFISYEFVIDVAAAAHEAGLKNVLVTNGYYNPEPFEELLPYVDAMNIDLKSIRDGFYKKLCQARLGPVLDTIERAAKSCLVEVTNLIVTDENDSDGEFQDLVDWVAGVSVDIPVHFSAYRPMYKLKNPSTPERKLMRAYEIAKEKLNYVYLGNVAMEVGQDSNCPHCGALLVERSGYATTIKSLRGPECGSCGNKVNFVNE